MQRKVVGLLWLGEVGEALSYLQEVSARRVEALSELVRYLEKHSHEIIDYERRQQAGKTIGTVSDGEGVDQAIIGYRQKKKKGMSWSGTGSKALGILKVVELNGQWEEMWFGRAAA